MTGGTERRTAYGFRLQPAVLAIALVGVAGCALGAVRDLDAFLRAYLVAEFVWLGLPVGALGLLLAYHLMGGRWGLAVGGVLEAAARTMPVPALLFLPILFNLEAVFPWAREAFLVEHEVVRAKAAFLDEPFFVARAVLYWIVWIGLAFALTTPERRFAHRPRRRGLAAAGAILWALTASFAAIDWAMSLEPAFYSSAFGMYVMAHMGLMAFAFAIPAAITVTELRSRESLLREEQLVGLGSILLSLAMLWAYLAYMQYLVIWSGNTPHHAEWYVARAGQPWSAMYWAIALAGGALPIAALLSSSVRRGWRALCALSALILATRVLEAVWITAPAFHDEPGPAWWLVAAAIAAIGALWASAFLGQLTARPRRVAADVEEASGRG